MMGNTSGCLLCRPNHCIRFWPLDGICAITAKRSQAALAPKYFEGTEPVEQQKHAQKGCKAVIDNPLSPLLAHSLGLTELRRLCPPPAPYPWVVEDF